MISPQPWWKGRPHLAVEPGTHSYGTEQARVLRPRYVHMPNRIRLGRNSLGRLNAQTYADAVRRVLPLVAQPPHVVYAHFLYKPGPAALDAARNFGVPSVVAIGESDPAKHESVYTRSRVRDTIHSFSGILCVSEVNRRYCAEVLGVPEARISVVPNAVDTSLFFPRDKMKMREKYGLPRQGSIVAFTGHFIERKGPLRVLEALERLPEGVRGLFLGSGPLRPSGDRVLFAGSVPHDQVAELLSASDVFALPTLHEGSCNALAEAAACGIPIVSSDIEAVREQLGTGNATLVDPRSIDDLANAISELLMMQRHPRAASRSNAMVFDLRRRAKYVLAFLERQSL